MARALYIGQALSRFEAKPIMSDTLPSTGEVWMRKSALHYLGQRSTSIANLRLVLLRRARRKLGVDVDASDIIQRTLDYCLNLGIVDDKAYAEVRITAGRYRGLSKRRICASLRSKGVDGALVAQAFATHDRDTLEERAAARLAQRKRIGPWRRLDRVVTPEKEIAVLARSGFDISLARRIVTGDPDEVQALLEV
jgi:regulatory protein